MVVRVANKQTADAGQQPQEPLRIASNEESDSLARLVAEMGIIRGTYDLSRDEIGKGLTTR